MQTNQLPEKDNASVGYSSKVGKSFERLGNLFRNPGVRTDAAVKSASIMSAATVRDCWIDTHRLAAIAGAMYNYGINKPDKDWPHNCLSIRTVAYTCGALCRAGDALEHNHDRAELERCSRLSAEVAQLMAGMELGMGSEGGSCFHPFFVAANVGTSAALDPDHIRSAFGGVIYPLAQIVVEPLEESGSWWQEVLHDWGGDEATLARWRAMIRWFREQPDFSASAFVMIGEDPLGGDNWGCVFPRLALGLTKGASLVGTGDCVVHT
jgi:hypothetical protein